MLNNVGLNSGTLNKNITYSDFIKNVSYSEILIAFVKHWNYFILTINKALFISKNYYFTHYNFTILQWKFVLLFDKFTYITNS